MDQLLKELITDWLQKRNISTEDDLNRGIWQDMHDMFQEFVGHMNNEGDDTLEMICTEGTSSKDITAEQMPLCQNIVRVISYMEERLDSEQMRSRAKETDRGVKTTMRCIIGKVNLMALRQQYCRADRMWAYITAKAQELAKDLDQDGGAKSEKCNAWNIRGLRMGGKTIEEEIRKWISESAIYGGLENLGECKEGQGDSGTVQYKSRQQITGSIVDRTKTLTQQIETIVTKVKEVLEAVTGQTEDIVHKVTQDVTEDIVQNVTKEVKEQLQKKPGAAKPAATKSETTKPAVGTEDQTEGKDTESENTPSESKPAESPTRSDPSAGDGLPAAGLPATGGTAGEGPGQGPGPGQQPPPPPPPRQPQGVEGAGHDTTLQPTVVQNPTTAKGKDTKAKCTKVLQTETHKGRQPGGFITISRIQPDTSPGCSDTGEDKTPDVVDDSKEELSKTDTKEPDQVEGSVPTQTPVQDPAAEPVETVTAATDPGAGDLPTPGPDQSQPPVPSPGDPASASNSGNDDPPPLNPPKPKPNPNPNQSDASGSGTSGGGSTGQPPAAGAGSGASGEEGKGAGPAGAAGPPAVGGGRGGGGGGTRGAGDFGLDLQFPQPKSNLGGSYGLWTPPDASGGSQSTAPLEPRFPDEPKTTPHPCDPTDLIPYTPAIIPAVVGIGLLAFFLWKLHLEVLNECEAAEWQNVKHDYWQILVEQFAQELMRDDPRNNNILGSGNAVTETPTCADPKTDITHIPTCKAVIDTPTCDHPQPDITQHTVTNDTVTDIPTRDALTDTPTCEDPKPEITDIRTSDTVTDRTTCDTVTDRTTCDTVTDIPTCYTVTHIPTRDDPKPDITDSPTCDTVTDTPSHEPPKPAIIHPHNNAPVTDTPTCADPKPEITDIPTCNAVTHDTDTDQTVLHIPPCDTVKHTTTFIEQCELESRLQENELYVDELLDQL
ncbi:hypothetical protein AK88_05354 [Plasmodium fragile]|uniref:Schizont-infected cell agglutination extracellular alpha domain-containing protein n=1 Tax=Plasmodium fragile TaxID=5857 RepID=A0A0D9QDU8_PLAFR|nr:uncharacterized protein AK88_05354 [Plasmodium fragile]KJP85012.1 hypothetical protein AK88_05354 [Plasmodium fragile]